MEWHDRIGRRLRLRDLHTFVAVAEAGSIARAAVRLSISQPAVSKAISNMEHTLGARLFDRNARGVAPTAHGQALLRHGLAAFDNLKHAVRELQFLSDPEGGELRLGSAQAMMGGLLPAIVARLTRRYPRLTFHIELASSIPLQYRDLRERKIELVLGRLIPSVTREPDLATDALCEEPSLVVASVRSRWIRRRKVTLEELASEQWMFPMPDTHPGSYAVEAFRNAGLELPRRRVLVNSIEMASALVATGRFLSVFPKSYLRFNARRWGLAVVRVPFPVKTPALGIVRLKNRPISPMAERFIACAKALSATGSRRP